MDNSNDKKMKKILLFIVFTSYGFSQGEITSLSLDDAIEYGIENNRRLMNAEREIKMTYKERWKIVWIILGTEILLFSIFAFGSEYLIGKGML